ncbi:methionyl-tRNA formyltransferase [Thermomicrobium sp.]
MESKLRLVFFGTPEFAVPALRTLAAQSDFAVVLVVTQPDRPAGRGRGLQPPPVKVHAQELGLPCWQPETLRTAEAQARLAAVAPMLAVVVAYGKIIPASMLSVPRYGFLNVHPSLLPRYRGASPIQAALLNGDAITGISFIVMTAELDAGPILRQFAIPIAPDDTGATLGTRLAEIAAELLPDTIRDWLADRLVPVPQDEREATYTPPLTKADGRVDWSEPAERIERKIRALQPWPCAWTTVSGRRLILLRARLLETEIDLAPGCLSVTSTTVLVGTGTRPLALETVQPEGKRAMSALDWWRGARLASGTCFE